MHLLEYGFANAAEMTKSASEMTATLFYYSVLFCISCIVTAHNQPACTLLPFIVSTEKTGAVIFLCSEGPLQVLLLQIFFCDHVQRAYWPTCKYTQTNLLSVGKDGTVLRERVFALLSVYCAVLIYLWSCSRNLFWKSKFCL